MSNSPKKPAPQSHMASNTGMTLHPNGRIRGLVNILAVGYSDEEAADPERHSQTCIPVEELFSYETV